MLRAFPTGLAFKTVTGSPFKTRLLLDGSWEQVIPCQSLDKDLLYRVLWDLIGKTGQRLQISYGDPEPPLHKLWKAEPGKELLVADPNQKNDLVRDMIHDAWLRIDHNSNQSRNHTWNTITMQDDLFAQLPFEILLMIISALDASSLMNLLHASPYSHRAFDGNGVFWLRQFQDHMPWFFEMHDFLSNSINLASGGTRDLVSSPDTNPFHHKSLRHFFAWANNITTPRVGMKGPFMGVGNRRRIWGVCARLVDSHLAKSLPRAMNTTLEEDETHIHSHTVCVDMALVQFPMPTLYTVKSFWMRTKSEVNAIKRGYTLKIFWQCRRLIGLGVVLETDEDSQLRLLGSDDYQDEERVDEDSMQVASGDWITGFILYYPFLNGSRTSWGPAAGWKTEMLYDSHVSGFRYSITQAIKPILGKFS